MEDVSDHLPVMVCSTLSLPKSKKSTVTLIRDTKNFDIEKFLNKLTEGMEPGPHRESFPGGTEIDAGRQKLSKELTDYFEKIFTQIWSDYLPKIR